LLAGPLWAATAYVSNEGSGTVSVIDTATDKITSTGKFAKKPRGIAIHPDGSRLYLSDQTANALVVVDTAKLQVLATVALGDSPEAIYVSPDGKWLSAAIEENDQVIIVDLAALNVARRIKMKGRTRNTRSGAPTASGSTSARKKRTAWISWTWEKVRSSNQ